MRSMVLRSVSRRPPSPQNWAPELRKFGIAVEPPAGESAAEAMFRIAYAAGARGEDPESDLRAVALAHADAMAVAERAASEHSTANGSAVS